MPLRRPSALSASFADSVQKCPSMRPHRSAPLIPLSLSRSSVACEKRERGVRKEAKNGSAPTGKKRMRTARRTLSTQRAAFSSLLQLRKTFFAFLAREVWELTDGRTRGRRPQDPGAVDAGVWRRCSPVHSSVRGECKDVQNSLSRMGRRVHSARLTCGSSSGADG